MGPIVEAKEEEAEGGGKGEGRKGRGVGRWGGEKGMEREEKRETDRERTSRSVPRRVLGSSAGDGAPEVGRAGDKGSGSTPESRGRSSVGSETSSWCRILVLRSSRASCCRRRPKWRAAQEEAMSKLRRQEGSASCERTLNLLVTVAL